jgi:3-methyladenine DNA glycosylase AlkC
MEPLKEMFGPVFFASLTDALKRVYRRFPAETFLRDVHEGLAPLSLNERMRHTSVQLRKHLPEEYGTSVGILREAIPLINKGYTTLTFPDFVSQYGTHDFKTSLEALGYFTRFGSSEFAIRTFLKLDFERTIKQMYRWSEDDNEHLRRLASEGSRPRLPWSFKLDAVIQNPKVTQPILENLKQDDSLYVRKSVANHINDLSKDSPAYVLELVKGWKHAHPYTAWIIKRGCRSLFKQGDKASLAVFNFTKDARVAIRGLKVNPSTVRIGEAVRFEFEVVSQKKSAQKLMIDYRIHFAKKSGALLPKVFKLKEVSLQAGESVAISKKQRFQNFTTREHFPGKHVLEILVNGEVRARAEILVVE